MNTKEAQFTGLRAYIWPVTGHEAKKVLPLALMMFFVLFNYTILRDVKDSLVLTAHGCGSESFSFLKFWGTLPFSIILMGIYSRLSMVLSKKALFRTTVLFFLGFFAVFGYVVFPNVGLVHASYEWIDTMAFAYPKARYITALLGNWSFALFYVFSELWGTVGLSVVFWQLANEITKVKEARRFYPLFGLVANFGVILSGQLLVVLTRMHRHLSATERWKQSMSMIMASLLISFCIIIYLHFWIQSKVMTDKGLYDPSDTGSGKKKNKVKLSFTESLKVLFTSKYLGFIALLVLGYGMTINFVEATFKNQVKLLYHNPADMTNFYGWYSTATGVTSVLLMIVGANMTRRLTWKTCALVTPLVVLLAGSTFFMLAIFKDQASVFLSALALSPTALAVYIGAGLVVIAKSAKYSLFDPTKEMAYIPLDDQLKTQGKAAVDGVGGRLGKSGAGIVQQMLFVLIPGATQMVIAPYLGVMLVVIALLWTYSVVGLSKLVEKEEAQ